VSAETKNTQEQNVDTYALRSTYYRGSLMISLCDAELVGMKLENNGLTINMTKAYWQERLVQGAEAESLLRKCYIANLAGRKIVDRAISIRLASPSSVKIYSGVPFLMLFRFTEPYHHLNQSDS
jgi:hypothetical protein